METWFTLNDSAAAYLVAALLLTGEQLNTLLVRVPGYVTRIQLDLESKTGEINNLAVGESLTVGMHTLTRVLAPVKPTR